jgi:paraquat-inducible protein A
MKQDRDLADAATADLIACPTCDLLHREVPVPRGGRLRCRRCGTVLMTNRVGAIDRTLASAFGSLVLMLSAIFFPFLEISVVGLHQRASLLDAAFAFTSGMVVPLSVATALLIIVIPLIRAAALAYTLLPLRLGHPPARGHERAFRLAAHLRPWAMAEVFLIGVVVALVKIGGMARIDLGPAFWAMAGLVVLVVYESASLCEWSIWQTLDRRRAR